MVLSHQRPLIIQSIEKLQEQYTPKQKFLREMREALRVVYQSELMGVHPNSVEWEATVTVDLIASYYEKHIPAEEKEKIHLKTENEPDYLKLRTIAVAAGLKQHEMLKKMEKRKLRQKNILEKKILNEDHLLVLEAVYYIDQYLNRA